MNKKITIALLLGLATGSNTAIAVDNITTDALVEVEAGFSNPEDGDSTSDIAVATAALSFSADINDRLSAQIATLYEEDDTDLEIDIAQLSYALNDNGLNFIVGQNYLPFGSFDTGLVSDTLTLELAETRETFAMLAYEQESLVGSLYVFNGDLDESGDSNIDSWGLNVAYTTDTFSGSASYINNLGDSDSLQGTFAVTQVNDYVAGLSLNANLTFGDVTLIAEHTTALDSFDNDVFAGAEPNATNLELNIGFNLAGKAATMALAFQSTDEAIALELPESRVLIGLGIELSDSLGLGLEYSHDQDYGLDEGGSDLTTDNVVIQIAAQF